MKKLGAQKRTILPVDRKHERAVQVKVRDSKKETKERGVTPRFQNNVNNTNNQSIQRKTECHTTKLYK